MNQVHLQHFAEAAARYCAWTTNEPRGAVEEARSALRHLSTLYPLALRLRELADAPEVEIEQIDDAAWRAAYERFGALPFNLYSSTFAPHQLDESPAEPAITEMGDLADDLADIDRDLRHGLSLFQEGQTEAAEWQWCWSFRNHWGRHAASALHALHCWFAEEDAW